MSSWKDVSYVMTSGTTSVGNLDVGILAADSVSRGYMTDSDYLIDLEAGFELWQGGAGLATDSYSVNVNHGGGTTTTGAVVGYEGLCLDDRAASTAEYNPIQVYTCNGTGARVWEPQPDGALLNPNSGKCLDDTGYGGSGTQVQIWSCSGNDNQSWTLP
jgi:Ricin-type beta-trefoil lectin domain/Glycosyl hydrolase family 12